MTFKESKKSSSRLNSYCIFGLLSYQFVIYITYYLHTLSLRQTLIRTDQSRPNCLSVYTSSPKFLQNLYRLSPIPWLFQCQCLSSVFVSSTLSSLFLLYTAHCTFCTFETSYIYKYIKCWTRKIFSKRSIKTYCQLMLYLHNPAHKNNAIILHNMLVIKLFLLYTFDKRQYNSNCVFRVLCHYIVMD